MPKSLVYRELVLHSSSVMYASLRCKLAYITDKWVMKFGECLNPLFMEYRFCIRLQFCYLAPLGFTQNWLEGWGECLNLSYTENWFCTRLQFCTLRYQNWLEVLASAWILCSRRTGFAFAFSYICEFAIWWKVHYFFKRASLFFVFLFVDISFLSGYTMGRTLSSPLQESVAIQFYSLNFAARFVIAKCLKVKIEGVCNG